MRSQSAEERQAGFLDVSVRLKASQSGDQLETATLRLFLILDASQTHGLKTSRAKRRPGRAGSS